MNPEMQAPTRIYCEKTLFYACRGEIPGPSRRAGGDAPADPMKNV